MNNKAGQSTALGNLGSVGGNKVYACMNSEKIKMFMKKYLYLSNELSYKKGENSALLRLGEVLSKQGQITEGRHHFDKVMKIS